MRTYHIRAHHGMCLAFFRGQGYSGAFVENMAKMKAVLEKNPEILLLDGPDDICAVCPNRESMVCGEKACRYDREVLQRCALSPGETLSFRDFSRRVEDTILRPGMREEICGDCQWSSLCQWQEDKT